MYFVDSSPAMDTANNTTANPATNPIIPDFVTIPSKHI
jgi:hypothetical protein